MSSLKFRCAELLLTNAVEKIEVSGLIADAERLYQWAKDCPEYQQFLAVQEELKNSYAPITQNP